MYDVSGVACSRALIVIIVDNSCVYSLYRMRQKELHDLGRGIASGGEGVQWWGARRRTAVSVPFAVYTMAWSGERGAFIVEGFIKNGGSPVATQWPPLSPDLTPSDFFFSGAASKQRFMNSVPILWNL